MGPSRYEPVPQYDPEPIILSPINAASYNYNTAVPNSVAPSVPSVPSSPPPSFRSSQSVSDDVDLSPGTPRAAAQANVRDWNNRTPTTITGETFGNDTHLQVAALKRRVEQLEECIGQLMLEKEHPSSDDPQISNCCVTFSDPSGDIERNLSRHKSHNCCVSFKKTKVQSQWHDRKPHIFLAFLQFVLIVLFIIFLAKKWLLLWVPDFMMDWRIWLTWFRDSKVRKEWRSIDRFILWLWFWIGPQSCYDTPLFW